MILTDYISLFPSHSRDMPRFMALAEAILRQATDLIALVPSLESGFSFAGAEGVLLDALGESVSIPRREGWNDETYRAVLLRKLKLWTWDGMNESSFSFLSEGETFCDNGDGTVTVSAEEPPPVPANEWYPVPIGVKATEI